MKIDYLLSYSIVPLKQTQDVNMLIKIKAPEKKQDEKQEPPLNICLVLDRSGSMEGIKLAQTKISAKMIVKQLKEKDILSIVVFDSDVQTLIMQEEITHDRTDLMRRIDSIHTKGSTNLSGALLKGIELLGSSKTDDSINRLLLLTDGCANTGITDPKQLVSIAKAAKDDSTIITTTLGFGNDFNEDLLIEMAKHSTGNFYYIEHADDAPKRFAEELHGIQQLVAQNISVKVSPTEHVAQVIQVTGHPQIKKEKELFIELGDAVADEEKRLLLTYELPELKSEGEKSIAEITVKYTELGDDTAAIKSVSQKISINAVDSDKADNVEPEVEVLQELALQESIKERYEAMDDMDSAMKDGNSERAKSAAKRLLSVADKLASLPAKLKNENIESEILSLREQADALLKASVSNNLDHDATSKIRKTLSENTMTIALSKFKQHSPPDSTNTDDIKKFFE